MTKLGTILILIIIVAIGALLWMYHSAPWLAPFLGGSLEGQQTLVGKASFTCDGGKTIAASFYQGSTTPAQAGQPPVANGSVALSLSDGRSLTLPQTISGSGIRYANADESMVFWEKGNTAFMTESGTTTFGGCVLVSMLQGQENWQTFASSTMGITFKYPPGYTAAAQAYTEMGPGKTIFGEKATIPASLAQGINLGSDSYASVEELPNAQSCTADQFLDLGNGATLKSVTDGDFTYSFASTTGAGAGNRYEEWVYAIPGSNPCTAVRYFIHYSVLENYPAGTVTAFNESALLSDFDGIRHSLVLGQ